MPAAKSRPPAQSKKKSPAPSKQIESFLAKYTPAMATAAKTSRAKMRRRVRGGVEFVYDNYNALVFGYGPTDRPSEAVLSLAIMPQWVTLCFLKGAKFPDPKKMLRGSGNIVRNIRLIPPVQFDDPDVQAFVERAITEATPAFPSAGGEPRTVIQSISAKQRPRRPRSA
jgi:hypothetical protein